MVTRVGHKKIPVIPKQLAKPFQWTEFWFDFLNRADIHRANNLGNVMHAFVKARTSPVKSNQVPSSDNQTVWVFALCNRLAQVMAQGNKAVCNPFCFVEIGFFFGIRWIKR